MSESNVISGAQLADIPLESAGGDAENYPIQVVRTSTILKSGRELYAFFRCVPNLARVATLPLSIVETSPTESRWTAQGADGGRAGEWDITIVRDYPGRLISWEAREKADTPLKGSIRFEPAPGEEGTEVSVTLEYVPRGKLAATLSRPWRRETSYQVCEALRRLKALMEAGEIPTTAGQPVGEPQRSRRT